MPPVYKLKDLLDTELEGNFYEKDLQKVNFEAPEEKEFFIEKIVRRRINKETGQREELIKWKGYGPKHNSWIPSGDYTYKRNNRNQK